jgi:thymidylate kinase
MPDQGHFIVLDAIDGAGKSTAMKAMAEAFKLRSLRIFDLVAYTKQHGSLPEFDDPEIRDADVLLSAEPTYCWVGTAIRDELIREHPGRSYDDFTAAQAFALDREILFSRVILPFLKARPDRWVIQDRGVISALAYQPLHDERVTLEWLLTLPGNKLELSRPPDLLMLLRLSPEEAMRRLGERDGNTDPQVYENYQFQAKLAARYRDPNVLAPYRDAGTRIVEIDASQTQAEVGQDVVRELETLF